MRTNNNEIFALTLPLKTEIWQEHLLNKRFKYCAEIQNEMIKKVIRILHYYSKTKEWQEIENLKNYKEKNKKIKLFIKKYCLPFNEYGVLNSNNKEGNKNTFSKIFANRYRKYGINTTITEYIWAQVWKSLEKYLYSKGKKISKKESDDFNSYKIRKKSGYFNGLTLNTKKSTLTIKLDDKRGNKGKEIIIPYIINEKSDYELFCFQASNEIREIGIKREFIRGKYKYFVIFTIEGKKPQKNRKLGKGKVGIDMGPSTIVAVGENNILMSELAENVNKYEAKIANLQRKMDRSKRQNNPLQFNEDGTIKRYPKGERPKWVYSKNYQKLKAKTKELYRKKRVQIKLSHNIKTNELLRFGNVFIVENNPYSGWARKTKKTTINKNGKINSKKRFGKSIQNHAPSQCIEILKNKVISLGGSFIKMDIKNAASQFDFINGQKTKHSLSQRNITLSNGNKHTRDAMAAFNIMHFDVNKNEYNIKEMHKHYPNFKKMEQKEINKLKNEKNLPKSLGIN